MTTTPPVCTICQHRDPAGAQACPTCQAALRAMLTELRHQLVLLRASLTPGASTGAHVASGRATAPLPVRLDVLSLLGPAPTGTVRTHPHDQTGPVPILGTLRDWAAAIAAERGLRAPARTTPDQCLTYLADHLNWICAQPWVTDLHAELRAVVRTVRGITRTQPRTRPLPAPCPCGAFGLQQTDWAEYVVCTVCRRQLTPQQYQQHAATALPPLYRLGLRLVLAAQPPDPGAPA
jgi:hypothetical protein